MTSVADSTEPAPPPAATPPSRPGLPRRVVRRARRELRGLRRVVVRQSGPDAVSVRWWPVPGSRRQRLTDPDAGCRLRGETLQLSLPDAAAVARLVRSGLLAGQVRELDLQLAAAPEWLTRGLRPPRLGRYLTTFSWRRRGAGLRVRLRWSHPQDLPRALTDLLTATLRMRLWDQTSGPVYAVSRADWITGGDCWPQAVFAAVPPVEAPDDQGRPLGAYLPAVAATTALDPPLVTTVANPWGRVLLGTATAYRLVGADGQLRLRDSGGAEVVRFDPRRGPESALLGGGLRKYAVVTVDAPVGPAGAAALRALAAGGAVFAAGDPAVRSELAGLGLVAVTDPAEVADLAGYARSVATSRQTLIRSDAALRRTALGGDGTLPLPTVTAVVSSMRAEHLDTCLRYLAGQTYPALEVVVGLHGYQVPEATRRAWAELLPFPLRVVEFPTEQPFGAVLGQLCRVAEGDLVTKLDDDDHYGPHHVTDLVLAWHTGGADVVAKGARFVHFPERDQTIDRAWAAPEIFDVTPAGGTMLLGRGVLQQVGGWSHSSKHVDADLLARIRASGGVVYRTHAMEYVYVRRTAGHTFRAEIDELVAQAERVYPGLPAEIIRPPHNW